MSKYWEYNKEFKRKVEYEMVAAAIGVMSEANTVDNHALRVTYAKTILNGTAPMDKVYIGFATNSTIKSRLTKDEDYTGDLAFVAGSLFNAFARVSL